MQTSFVREKIFKRLGRIVVHTIKRFGEERAAEAAASMAFFAIFSLFPLVLVLIVAGSIFLESPKAQDQVLEMILQVFPFASDLIRVNIKQVLAVRGQVGIIAAISLSWSATGVFSLLTRNINRAWPDGEPHNFFKMRLRAFGILVFLVLSLVLILISNTVMRLLPKTIVDAASEASASLFFPQILLWLFLLITLLLLYWGIPSATVVWSDAAVGALIASVGIEIVTASFTFFLDSGLSNYNLVYGSLGAVVALIFWIYLLNLIVLFGAHLSASIAYWFHPR
jgi:membrane protein